MKINESSQQDMMQISPLASQAMEKWNPQIRVIDEAFGGNLDYLRAATTASLLETANNHIARLSAARSGSMMEATQTSDVGYFKNYAINLLSATIPNLIAHDLVSIQPLGSRVGEIRFLKVTYGSNKGQVTAGDTMFSTFQGGNGTTTYSSQEVDSELFEAAEVNVEGNLAWTPVIPGSLQILADTTDITDDGNGGLVGATGTIDYATGKFTITLPAVPADGQLSFNYSYNNIDSPVKAPEVNLKIESSPIIAKSRKLKAIYSFDAAYDLSRDYGLGINAELESYTAAQIKHEIDGEIMSDLYKIAGAKSTTWDATPREGISVRDHNESFFNVILEGGNNIFEATKLANASFVIVGTEVSNIIESLPRFREAGVVKPVGPHLVGYLGNLPIYKNPFYTPDTFLVGWRGVGLFDAGYIYAPYMPIMSTDLITDANFQGQQGFATSYGKKPVNSKMYSKGLITRS